MNLCLINKLTRECEKVLVFEDVETAEEMFGETYVIAKPYEDFWVGDIYKDGIWTKAPVDTAKLREKAYNTMTLKEDGTPLIPWEEQEITVTAASQLFMYYLSEVSDKAKLLSDLIVSAKTYIRDLYAQ